jgi:allantoicase
MVIKSNDFEELVSRISQIPTSVIKDVHEEVENIPAKNVAPPSLFANHGLINIMSASTGSRVFFATDEWFAAADNLLQDGPPIFDPSLFCEQGKVMDGWETRRRREAGHDWCIISLSRRASVVGIEIDTAHFTGNNVPHISIEIADLSPSKATALASSLPNTLERLLPGSRQGVGHSPQEVQEALKTCLAYDWKELLPRSPLRPGYESSRMHYFTLPPAGSLIGTHIRVNYYPDGGVARLRLWANPVEEIRREVQPLYMPISTGKICSVVPHSTTDTPPSQLEYPYVELSASTHGGRGLLCSNKHYGEPTLLIQESLGKDMGDGWETARHPDRPAVLDKDPQTGLIASSLMDWAIIKLGSIAADGVNRVLLDTKHFRGNYPESVMVEGCFAENGTLDHRLPKADWFVLVKRTRMSPDAEHIFDSELGQLENATRAVTHVRISIYPDGGLSRVRIYGRPLDISQHGMISNL